ncbi:MAG: hypothetical protein ACJ8LG_20870 [Massilia sp.]
MAKTSTTGPVAKKAAKTAADAPVKAVALKTARNPAEKKALKPKATQAKAAAKAPAKPALKAARAPSKAAPKQATPTKAAPKQATAKKAAPKEAAAKKAASKAATGKKPAPAAKEIRTAAKAAAKAVAKPALRRVAAGRAGAEAPKPKLVRDSFTMPEDEYAVLAEVKQACLKAGFEIKKSELLRIGVALVGRIDVATLQGVLAGLPQLKTGRPRAR